jgi:two-component system, NtrC family, response regulator AtoC
MAKNRILVVDDEDLMREYVEEALTRAGHSVQSVASGQEAQELLRKCAFDLVVTDLKMTPMDGLTVLRTAKEECPGTPVILMTAYGTVETAVGALKEGAADYILKPFAPDELELAIDRALHHRRLAQENQYLRKEVNHRFDFQSMVGASPAMKQVYETIQRVAASKATVLIRGESGTGKELVARAIHYGSARSERAFIKVNCAALSAGLLESELFGHEKGSFTGAHDRKIGRFELADEGTLLLDEISEISIELQPKLLRALQEREFERVGGNQAIQVDTRIIATSNRNLEKAVEAGTFREDLFFRLNVIPIALPPLRERPEDIPALMDHFLTRFTAENGRTIQGFSDEARRRFLDYRWPRNVRELQNAIERAVVLSTDSVLEAEHFTFDGTIQPSRRVNSHDVSVPVGTTVAEMEKALIGKTLNHCGNNRTKAADMMGISVRTLRNKLREYRDRGEAL